ncbi:hypothetical protein B0H13DRAFT_2343686 [Mycena leptocephala]|nr:hypothetical protein B0H13DRAFT_2343686 [Mycena leptocephala]
MSGASDCPITSGTRLIRLVLATPVCFLSVSPSGLGSHTPSMNIFTCVPRTHHRHGCAHARPPLPRRMDPLPSFTAHSLSRQHPVQDLAPHTGKPGRTGAARTRTFAAAAPAPAPDGAVVGPIPVKASGERLMGA